MAEKCHNAQCQNSGRLACKACKTVSYCSSDCQKIDWKTHKIVCKEIQAKQQKPVESSPPISQPLQPSSSITSNPIPNAALNESLSKLKSLKTEFQNSLQSNDTKSAIKIGQEAIILANTLPDAIKTVELVQLHLNISNILMQTQQVQQAEPHVKIAVENAENGIKLRPNNPQALDMLSYALVLKAYWLCNVSKFDEAKDCALRARTVAEQIYSVQDPRNFKTLRCLGMIYDKLDNKDEAESYLSKAYAVQIQTHGPTHPESLIILQEVMELLFKKKDYEKAEKFARNQYDNIHKKIKSPEHDNVDFRYLGDAASMLASCCAKINKLDDAEKYIKEAVVAREKRESIEPHTLPLALIGLAGVYELIPEKSKEDIVEVLKRAHGLFVKLEGANSFHALQTLESIQNIEKGNRKTVGQILSVDNRGLDEDGLRVTSENKINGKKPENGAKPTKTLTGNVGIPIFAPDDANGRMKQAATYFEAKEFRKAEVLLQEAFKICERTLGPDHVTTKACQQNIGVVRHHALDQLWKEVANEMTDKMGNLSLDEDDLATAVSSSASASSEVPSWVIQDTKSSSCIIC